VFLLGTYGLNTLCMQLHTTYRHGRADPKGSFTRDDE